MAFKATNILPEAALREAKKAAIHLRNFTEARAATLGASGADSFMIFNIVEALIEFKRRLEAVRATPGIAQYAKDQENDQTYDVTAEFNAMIAAIDAAINEVVATFPADVNDYLLAAKFNADGTLQHRAFSVAALSGIKSRLDDIVAAIV